MNQSKPALMFQGTGSDAGKSLMTAAFCRILSDEGVRVAPFKAQNMSLNSWVTAEGGEMGRAQVLQAAASRTEPQVLMNPVLLKPLGEQKSQVILRGKPLETVQARQYYENIETLRREVNAAYDDLALQYDAVVLEGAGSPGEVNLTSRDIVNMSMAAHAEAAVILVGDIDRGGVYASFIGHLAVMDEWERRLVSGFLVNKFRGDATLLEDAHQYMVRHTGKPVVGVMPWVRDHRLPEEDGVDFEERYGRRRESDPQCSAAGDIIVGVVELPHISNSTDIDPFLGEPHVQLVRLDSGEAFRKHRPNGVVIPGTRNVMNDYKHIRNRGLAAALRDAARAGETVIAGICGSFQMLGTDISDPLGLEGVPGGHCEALGLLNIRTVLEQTKILTQTEVHTSSSGRPVTGYEIHHSRSEYSEEELFVEPGLGCRNGNVWGTYLHGIFENDEIRQSFLRDCGRPETAQTNRLQSLDEALDRFAESFRQNVDVAYLKRSMGL